MDNKRRITNIKSFACLSTGLVKRKKQLKREESVTMDGERRIERLLPNFCMKIRENTVPNILKKSPQTKVNSGQLISMEEIRSIAKKTLENLHSEEQI